MGFSGKHVVFVVQRRILAKPTRKANKLKQKRPNSRTLQAVHNNILDDLVYPAEIVGKRIRIHLDKTQQTNIEHKTDTFASVYKKLTGKEVTFEFPRGDGLESSTSGTQYSVEATNIPKKSQ